MITRQFVAISLAFCTLSSASGAQISDVIKVQQNLEHRIRDGGKQPTYENCVTESASLSTEEEVTKWYIDQFLNSKSVLHLLFAKPAGLDINAPIIDFCKHTFSCITRKNKEKQCDCEDLDAVQNLKDSFCQSFREIAQSPVGRMLLYRLLIEIYRNDNNQGTLGKDILEEISNHKLQVRNLSRNIKVVSDTAFAILEANQKKGYTQAFFKFSAKSQNICKQIIFGRKNVILTGADYKKYNCYFVTKAEKSFSASVFHELLHFFHILRNIERRDMEKVSNNCAFTVLSPSTIGRFYYTQKEGHNDHYRTKHTTLPWVTRNPTYNQEEHRTICGVPLPKQSLNQLTEDANSSEPKYLAGDELSENAFLFSLQHQLRDGHSDFNFYEDSDVVKKIFDVASFSNDEKAREQLDKILWCGKDMVYLYDRMEKGCLYLGASCIAELGVGEFLIPGGRKDK